MPSSSGEHVARPRALSCTELEIERGRLPLTKPKREAYIHRLIVENKIRVGGKWEYISNADAHQCTARTVRVLATGQMFTENNPDFPSEFLVAQLMLVVG